MSKNAKRQLQEIQERRQAQGHHDAGMVGLHEMLTEGIEGDPRARDASQYTDQELSDYVKECGVDVDRLDETPRELVVRLLKETL